MLTVKTQRSQRKEKNQSLRDIIGLKMPVGRVIYYFPSSQRKNKINNFCVLCVFNSPRAGGRYRWWVIVKKCLVIWMQEVCQMYRKISPDGWKIADNLTKAGFVFWSSFFNKSSYGDINVWFFKSMYIKKYIKISERVLGQVDCRVMWPLIYQHHSYHTIA